MAIAPDYPILTPRLALRPFTRGDLDAVFAYRGRADVARFLFDPPLSRDECALAIQQRIAQIVLEKEGDRIILAVDEQRTGLLVGEVSLIWRAAEARQGEVGWIFHPEHQGRGLATEAASALLDIGFGLLDLHRIFARCDVGNGASWRLMERLGMRREAHLREHAMLKGRWDEEFHYALLQREWIAMRHPILPA